MANIKDTIHGMDKLLTAFDVLIKQQIATKKALQGTTKTMSAQTKTVEKTNKSVKDMVGNYYSLADAQTAVNDTSKTFSRRFAEAAQATGKGGKAWTMFSRVLSGSPLWKLQNYVRSVGQAMDFLYTKSEEATKAANKQALAMGTLTANIEQVEEQLKLMNKAGNHKELIESNLEYKNTFEALVAAGEEEQKARKLALARTQSMYDNTLKNLKKNLATEGEALKEALEKEFKMKKKAEKRKLLESDNANFILGFRTRMRYKKLTKDLVKLKEDRVKQQAKVDALQKLGITGGAEADKLEKIDVLIKSNEIGRKIMDRKGGGSVEEIMALKKEIRKGRIEGAKNLLRKMPMAILKGPFMPLILLWKGIRKQIKKNGGVAQTAKVVFKIITKVMKMALLYSMYFILFLVGALLAFVFIKKIFEKAEVMNVLMETLGGVFEGIKEMFGGVILIFEAFFGGGTLKERFTKLFKGILGLYKGLGKIVFSVVIGAGKLLIKLIVAYFVFVIETYIKIFRTVTKKEFWTKTVSGALVKARDYLMELVPKIGDKIGEYWSALKKWVNSNVIDPIMNALDFELLHTGGSASGGMTMVGERGPELVNLPAGSQVHSNDTTKSMIGGHVTNNVSVSVNGRLGASDSELRDIAKKIGSMVSAEINRTTSSSTNVRF